MKNRFLVHSLSRTVLAVNITSFGLPTEIYPKTGQEKSVPATRFQSWQDAEQFFLGLGADPRVLKTISAELDHAGVTVLTIV